MKRSLSLIFGAWMLLNGCENLGVKACPEIPQDFRVISAASTQYELAVTAMNGVGESPMSGPNGAKTKSAYFTDLAQTTAWIITAQAVDAAGNTSAGVSVTTTAIAPAASLVIEPTSTMPLSLSVSFSGTWTAPGRRTGALLAA